MTRLIADVLSGNLPKRPPCAHLYVRVSTDRQCNSPQAQKDALGSWHRSLGSHVQCEVYDDLESAFKVPLALRPEGGRMIRNLEPGDIVAAVRGDRLVRNALEAAQLIDTLGKKQVKLYLIDTQGLVDPKDAMSRLVYTITTAGLGEYERHLIAERTRVAMRNMRMRNLPTNRYGCRYGFKVQEGVAVPDPYEQAIREMIWKMHVQLGLGKGRIATVLNRRGIPCRDRKWGRELIGDMLTEEAEQQGVNRKEVYQKVRVGKMSESQLALKTAKMFEKHGRAVPLTASPSSSSSQAE